MLSPQEKLKLMRAAEVSPGLATFQFFEIIHGEIMALLSGKLAEIQTSNEKERADILSKIDAISSKVDKSITEIKTSVEEINQRILDEEKIADAVSSKVKIPTPINGHTPTSEELTALIKSLLPKSSAISQEISSMVKDLMPEAPKPISEDELLALVQPLIDKLKSEDTGDDSTLEDRIKTLEEQIKALANLPRNPKAKGGKYLHGAGAPFAGSQEKSSTIPNGVLQTFSFAHTPALIYWNGQMQTLTDDYNVSGLSITFTGTNIPVIGDKIVNVYG